MAKTFDYSAASTTIEIKNVIDVEKYKACDYQGTVPFDLANGSRIKFGCLSNGGGCCVWDGFPSPAAVPLNDKGE